MYIELMFIILKLYFWNVKIQNNHLDIAWIRN